MNRRRTLACALAAAAIAAGCASLDTVSSDISTYGEWPAGRSAGTYVFERLPSQQAQPEAMATLEAAAAAALERAGFRPAADPASAEFSVQLAMRSTRTDVDPWADPLWWRGGYIVYRHGWHGPVWPAWQIDLRQRWPRVDREVAGVCLDATPCKPLSEARAAHEGHTMSDAALAGPLFRAALVDFPKTGPNPRAVTVPRG